MPVDDTRLIAWHRALGDRGIAPTRVVSAIRGAGVFLRFFVNVDGADVMHDIADLPWMGTTGRVWVTSHGAIKTDGGDGSFDGARGIVWLPSPDHRWATTCRSYWYGLGTFLQHSPALVRGDGHPVATSAGNEYTSRRRGASTRTPAGALPPDHAFAMAVWAQVPTDEDP